MAMPCWKHILCPRSQLCLETVLSGGQSFRWKQNAVGEWLGVISDQVWRLKQTDKYLMYQVYPGQTSSISQIHNPKSLGFSVKTSSETSEIIPLTKSANFKIECSNKTGNLLPDIEKSGRGNLKRIHGRQKTVLKRDHEKAATENMKSETDEQESSCLDLDNNNNIVLLDYFQLDIDLEHLYSHWSSEDKHFAEIGQHFPGIRILRQDPVENMISFVCSSNNHISRITSMVEKLCNNYGNFIAKVDGTDYYSFPTLQALCEADMESQLRVLSFGYRAKFISSIARHVTQDKEEGWLFSLRDQKYPEAKAELMTLLGVGAKVADCVCLMSLDKAGAVPVDTHVWQITMKNYIAKLQNAKSLTTKLYQEIGDFYRNLWGPYAGWAHSVLFIADLKPNKDIMKGKIQTATKIMKTDQPVQDQGDPQKSKQRIKKKRT